MTITISASDSMPSRLISEVFNLVGDVRDKYRDEVKGKNFTHEQLGSFDGKYYKIIIKNTDDGYKATIFHSNKEEWDRM